MSFWNGNEPVLFFKMSVTKDDEQCLMVTNRVFEHYWLFHYHTIYYIITILLCSNIAISYPPCLLFALFLLFPNGGAASSDIKL